MSDGVRLYFEVRALDDFCRNLPQKGFRTSQLPRMMPWGWRHAYLKSTQPEPDNTAEEPSEMIQEPSTTREDVVSDEPTEHSTAGNIPAASPKVPSENLEATASHGLDASEAELSSGAEESAGTNPPTEWGSLDSEDERAITEALKAEEPENWEFPDQIL